MVYPIVLAGVNSGGSNKNFGTVNTAYVAYFLTDYLLDEWIQQYHQFPLTVAPAVFWDLCDAGTPRKSGQFSYSFDLPTVPAKVPISAEDWGAPLGIGGVETVNSYLTINTSVAGYTAANGAAATREFLLICGDLLDCVKRCDYKAIKDNDPSLFHETVGITTSMTDSYGLGNRWNNPENDGTANVLDLPLYNQAVQAPQCLWLARLAITNPNLNGTDIAYAKHLTLSHSPSTTIIGHRILNRLRGYDNHTDDVILKVIPFSTVYNAFVAYMTDVNTVSASTYIATATIGEYDGMICLINFIRLHFRRWMHLAGQYKFSYVKTTSSRLDAGGYGCVPLMSWSSIRMPAVIARAMARLYPTYRDGIAYYPQLWMDTVTLNTESSIWSAAGHAVGQFSPTTGKDGTGEIVQSSTFSNKIEVLIDKWNTAMRNMQVWCPISPKLTVSDYVLTELTYGLAHGASATSDDHYIMQLTGSTKPATIVQDILPSSFIPVCLLPNDDIDKRGHAAIEAQHFYNERHKEHPNGYASTHSLVVYTAWIISTHDKYNKGTSEAETDRILDEIPDGPGMRYVKDVGTKLLTTTALKYAASGSMAALTSLFTRARPHAQAIAIEERRGADPRLAPERYALHEANVHDEL